MEGPDYCHCHCHFLGMLQHRKMEAREIVERVGRCDSSDQEIV